MRQIILFLFLIPSFLYADDLCDFVGKLVVECYHKREKGELKSCNVKIYEIPALNRACQVGCLSESLYEANLSSELLKSECESGYF
ncbi:MAG TPA: hypothetical protein DEP48_08160 [Persephonella sp.]|uniref:hypothetical protein n=1 Tax=Persephonella marina TaxID=309805 RepID=UPI00059F7C4C|nr:hypothetical protein [Persephonella marina]HCB70316.1 hypothetical protein [Persephonella sp.]